MLFVVLIDVTVLEFFYVAFELIELVGFVYVVFELVELVELVVFEDGRVGYNLTRVILSIQGPIQG